jgi:pimeloyl-ACP methyl ester carboxylesterase
MMAKPTTYRIRVKGHLPPKWSEWFDDMTITLEPDGDTILAGPVVDQPVDVPTRLGTTHINTSGPENAPAMVLLPGFGTNSTMWFPNIAALSSRFRVYALDTIGQPGKSVPSGVLAASNSSNWIADVLDGLELEKACMVGISLGG